VKAVAYFCRLGYIHVMIILALGWPTKCIDAQDNK